MESDDDMKGDGLDYTTEYRQYDPRVGRWFSPDPIVKPWESPYAAFANNPIYFTDPSGLNPEDPEGPPATGTEGEVWTYTSKDGKTQYWQYSGSLGAFVYDPEWEKNHQQDGSGSYSVRQSHPIDLTLGTNSAQAATDRQDGTLPTVAQNEESASSIVLLNLAKGAKAVDGNPYYKSANSVFTLLNETYYLRPGGMPYTPSSGVKTIAGGFENLGYAFSAIIIAKDLNEIANAWKTNQDIMNAPLGTLVIDASGIVLGIISPALGVALSISEMAKLDPDYGTKMFAESMIMLRQLAINAGYDWTQISFTPDGMHVVTPHGAVTRGLTDNPEYKKWNQIYFQYCPNCHKQGGTKPSQVSPGGG
jgi:RHS repeat-associated protein